MIPQACVKLHPCSIEQRVVGLLEFNPEVPRGMPSVDVIAQHHDKIEWESGSRTNHLLSHVVLIGIAGATIPITAKRTEPGFSGNAAAGPAAPP